MKNNIFITCIIAMLIMLMSGESSAQRMDLYTFTTMGVAIGESLQPDEFTSVIEIRPQLTYEKFSFAGIAMTYSRNEESGYFAGAEVGYRIDNTYTASIHGLLGEAGQEMLGLGVEGEFNRMVILAKGGWEFRDREAWIQGGVGYRLTP